MDIEALAPVSIFRRCFVLWTMLASHSVQQMYARIYEFWIYVTTNWWYWLCWDQHLGNYSNLRSTVWCVSYKIRTVPYNTTKTQDLPFKTTFIANRLYDCCVCNIDFIYASCHFALGWVAAASPFGQMSGIIIVIISIYSQLMCFCVSVAWVLCIKAGIKVYTLLSNCKNYDMQNFIIIIIKVYIHSYTSNI